MPGSSAGPRPRSSAKHHVHLASNRTDRIRLEAGGMRKKLQGNMYSYVYSNFCSMFFFNSFLVSKFWFVECCLLFVYCTVCFPFFVFIFIQSFALFLSSFCLCSLSRIISTKDKIK